MRQCISLLFVFILSGCGSSSTEMYGISTQIGNISIAASVNNSDELEILIDQEPIFLHDFKDIISQGGVSKKTGEFFVVCTPAESGPDKKTVSCMLSSNDSIFANAAVTRSDSGYRVTKVRISPVVSSAT